MELAFEGAIFDLDGVVTRTARIHAEAWKRTFDDFIGSVEGDSFKPFDIKNDYLTFVDGKPRYDGAGSFLRSRGYELPPGDPSDGPDERTVCGIGNRKNILYQSLLAEMGAEVFPSTMEFIREAGARGAKIGAATSSRNGELVLSSAGILDIFEARIDGVVSAELGLKGKPEPDIFLTCAERLGVDPERSMMAEDAISGVAAGRAGGFGLVLGIDREDQKSALIEAGADIVIEDFREITIEEVNDWFRRRKSL